MDNLFIHLTNNAVQKYAENYGQYEDGNQKSYILTFVKTTTKPTTCYDFNNSKKPYFADES